MFKKIHKGRFGSNMGLAWTADWCFGCGWISAALTSSCGRRRWCWRLTLFSKTNHNTSGDCGVPSAHRWVLIIAPSLITRRWFRKRAFGTFSKKKMSWACKFWSHSNWIANLNQRGGYAESSRQMFHSFHSVWCSCCNLKNPNLSGSCRKMHISLFFCQMCTYLHWYICA